MENLDINLELIEDKSQLEKKRSRPLFTVLQPHKTSNTILRRYGVFNVCMIIGLVSIMSIFDTLSSIEKNVAYMVPILLVCATYVILSVPTKKDFKIFKIILPDYYIIMKRLSIAFIGLSTVGLLSLLCAIPLYSSDYNYRLFGLCSYIIFQLSMSCFGLTMFFFIKVKYIVSSHVNKFTTIDERDVNFALDFKQYSYYLVNELFKDSAVELNGIKYIPLHMLQPLNDVQMNELFPLQFEEEGEENVFGVQNLEFSDDLDLNQLFNL